MMNKLLPNPLLSIAFLVLWLLLGNEWSAAQLALGLFVGWLMPILMQRFWKPVIQIRHPLRLLVFLLRMQYDIFRANLTVARCILSPTKRLRPAFLEVPLDVRNDFVITVLSSVISLTPGTVVADVSPDRRRLLVHTLDTRDPSAVVRDIKERYERRLMEIFGC